MINDEDSHNIDECDATLVDLIINHISIIKLIKKRINKLENIICGNYNDPDEYKSIVTIELLEKTLENYKDYVNSV